MRRRILLLVVSMTTLVVLAFAIPLAVLIRHTVYRDAQNALQAEAAQITSHMHRSYTKPTDEEIAAYLAKQRGEREASVLSSNGRLIGDQPPGGLSALRSAISSRQGQPPFGDPDRDGQGDGGGPGDRLGGRPIAFAGGSLVVTPTFFPGGDRYIVLVYASDDQLHSGETGWWWLLAGASAGLLLLGVLAGELLTRRIVRPLVETASTAQRLSAGDTTARAPTTGPVEVADVGRGLNRLADRIDQLIADERETVADLSHRLRTPLTALRLDAEALRDPGESERVGQHVSALERMLTALIRAARRPQREGRMPSCDATEVVDQRVQFWSALAEDQGRTVGVWLPHEPVPVRAGAEDLSAAVDALLENVVAHTPEGTAFSVRLTALPAEEDTTVVARLEVSDDGPGLPPDAEVRGRSDRGSSGLGLDIARRCAEASGGSMTLGAAPSRGALITLTFGAP